MIPACRECNEAKGGRWPTADEVRKWRAYWEGQVALVEDALRTADAIRRTADGSLPVYGKAAGRKRRRR